MILLIFTSIVAEIIGMYHHDRPCLLPVHGPVLGLGVEFHVFLLDKLSIL
jgi:hypothetical protein